MARLMVKGDRLVLRLNPLEKLLDLRLVSPTVPVAAVDGVDIIDDPTNLMETETSFGFAGNTAPGRGIMTASSRGRFDGGRAAVFVYFRGQSVRANITAGQGWRVFLVSSRSVRDDCAALQKAMTRKP